MKDSVELEKLVARIQSQLAPNSKVEHDVDLPTIDGKRTRQIDVLVTDYIGQYEFKIIIDCKDHSKKLGVRDVGTFHDLLLDVGAHRGVLVCPKGFTSGARDRANQLKIDLYSPIDTDSHKWQVTLSAPCIIDYRSAAISIRLSASSPHPWVIPYDMNEGEYYNEDKIPLPSLYETMFNNWFEGKYPIEAGVHERQKIYEGRTLMRVNPQMDLIQPVDLSADVYVVQRYYFGYVKIDKISGFLDHRSGGIITNAFEFLVDHQEVEMSWEIINSEKEAPVRPLIRSIGLIAHRLN